MALLRKLLAKQKADTEEAERKQEERLEKRRGYARAARDRDRELARQNGLSDLPPLVAVAIEEALKTPAPVIAKPVEVAATVEELVARLTLIRERLFWLQAVFATTLSDDAFHEAEKYRKVFRELYEKLHDLDPAAGDRLVASHEALLLSEPAAPRPRLSLAVQQWFELAGEVQSRSAVRAAPKPDGYVSDGLQAFL
jgi:hypothetical protein